MKEFLKSAIAESEYFLDNEKVQETYPLLQSSNKQIWKIHLNNGKKLFAKILPAEEFEKLKFEELGLIELLRYADKEYLDIPKPFFCKKLSNYSIIVSPWLNIFQGNQSMLGKGLALLHKASAISGPDRFGFEENGFIGEGKQIRGWRKNWGECFIELRLKPQIHLANKWGFEIEDLSILLDKVQEFLNRHNPRASLVHGDFWGGNAATNRSNKGIIFDPAVYWADREVDIAMSQLFGGFSHEFYESYEKVWPLSKFHKQRFKIYNCYHLLNHANIFGGSYKAQCQSCMKEIANIIS